MDEDTSNQLAELLNKYQPGFLPLKVFEGIGRLVVYSAIEVIPIRSNNGAIEVLLFKRPENDFHWPSMLHTPGVILIATDESLDDAFKRLSRNEVSLINNDNLIFNGNHMLMARRGRYLSLEYLLIMDGVEPNGGEFYDVKNLPSNFIEEQRPMVERAVERYTKMGITQEY